MSADRRFVCCAKCKSKKLHATWQREYLRNEPNQVQFEEWFLFRCTVCQYSFLRNVGDVEVFDDWWVWVPPAQQAMQEVEDYLKP